MLHRAAEVPARIPVLEPAHEEGIDGGAGHHAKLAADRDRPRQAPAWNPDAHPALDDRGKREGRHNAAGGGGLETWPGGVRNSWSLPKGRPGAPFAALAQSPFAA